MQTDTRRTVIRLASVARTSIAVACFLASVNFSAVVAAPVSGKFEDVTERVGVYFHHRMLWPEQGEGMKVNHYGHGSGVLVADVNGDGRMDLYFLNQDGPNALYVQRADGSFIDRASIAGVAGGDRVCSGGAFGDIDNDGDEDLYVTSIRGGNLLFENKGDGTFADVSRRAGVDVSAHSTTACFFDLDGDGFLDLYVGNQAIFTSDTYNPDRRYFVGQPNAMHSAGSEPDRLFRNKGDATFEDVTARAGIQNNPEEIMAGLPPPAGLGGSHDHHDGGPSPRFWTMDCAVGDFDDDGWPDLYVTNSFGLDVLYHNERNGTLAPVTREVLPTCSFGSFGARWADVNNDGRLDLYVVDMHSDMWCMPPGDFPVARIPWTRKFNSKAGPTLMGEDPMTPRPNHPYTYGNTCFLNQGNGKFVEVSDALGLENFMPWGVCASDFDRDGYCDFFVPAGMGWPWEYTPNFFYLNQQGKAFREAAREVGIEPRTGGDYLPGITLHAADPTLTGLTAFAHSTRAAATVDIDNDGAVDLVLQNRNDRATILRNGLAAEGHWIGFALVGKKSNRNAVGAKIRVSVRDETRVQMVSGAGGYLQQSDPRLVFGLGKGDEIRKIEVVWPGGRVQKVDAFALDTYNRVVETP